jgi:putative oxidoreductase
MATNAAPHPATSSAFGKTAALWTLQIAIAFMMLTAGWPKLAGDPTMVQVFQGIGFGQWFRYLTGALEIIGGVGLLIPKLSGYAALLIATVMFGAVLTHLVLLGGSPATALALFLSSGLVAWVRLGRK